MTNGLGAYDGVAQEWRRMVHCLNGIQYGPLLLPPVCPGTPTLLYAASQIPLALQGQSNQSTDCTKLLLLSLPVHDHLAVRGGGIELVKAVKSPQVVLP